MHEMSVVESLIETVRSAQPDGSRVIEVRIDVGGLEHLDELVLQEAWRVLTHATHYSQTRLKIDVVPVRIRCVPCRSEYEPEEPSMLICPVCGAARPEVLAGRGILLRSLEVDEPITKTVE